MTIGFLAGAFDVIHPGYIRMFKDARTPEQVKSETQFSRAVDANVKSNPDLKQTFDNFVQNEDGLAW